MTFHSSVFCRTGLLLCLALPTFAQFDSTAVVGTVRDARGGSIAEAKVTLVNNATGLKLSTSTAASGDYSFPTVRIGEYTVTAEMAGFSKAVAEKVAVTVNARQRVDLVLNVGQVNETVNVVAATPLLETDSSSKGQINTNFAAPTVDISSAAFGRVTSTFDPRLIQLALKLTF